MITLRTLRTLRGMTGQWISKLPHPELRIPRIRKAKADIKSLIDFDMMKTTGWIHYLLMSQTSLACPLASWPHRQWLRIFSEHSKYQTFRQTILDDDPPSVKFHKMRKQRVKTFSTISTKTCRYVPTKNKQGRTCQGAWEKCISCRSYHNSINLYHWGDGSGTKNERP